MKAVVQLCGVGVAALHLKFELERSLLALRLFSAMPSQPLLKHSPERASASLLRGETEKERVGCAYRLGARAAQDPAAVEALATALLRPEEELRRAAMNGAAAAGAAICPALCEAVAATLAGPARGERFSVLAGLAHALGHTSPGGWRGR